MFTQYSVDDTFVREHLRYQQERDELRNGYCHYKHGPEYFFEFYALAVDAHSDEYSEIIVRKRCDKRPYHSPDKYLSESIGELVVSGSVGGKNSAEVIPAYPAEEFVGREMRIVIVRESYQYHEEDRYDREYRDTEKRQSKKSLIVLFIGERLRTDAFFDQLLSDVVLLYI